MTRPVKSFDAVEPTDFSHLPLAVRNEFNTRSDPLAWPSKSMPLKLR
jgi:hypothetical protein